MERQKKHNVLIQNIKKLITIYQGKSVIIKAIIFVGSNHSITDLDDNLSRDSDLDFIVLVEGDTFSINTNYKDHQYDLTIINPSNFLNLIINGYERSPFASKIFSSLKDYTIIKDTKNIARYFVHMTNKIYEILVNAVLPNFSANSIFLDNIKANLSDTKKNDATEVFFAYDRLSTHVFDYISRLIYPFNLSGSYRGKMFKKYLKNLRNNVSLNAGQYFINDKFIEGWIEKFSPILECNYRAFTFSSSLKEKVLSGQIELFYFGYDNILSENTIIFLPEEEFLKNKDKMNFEALNLSNIVPLFSKPQLDSYTSLLSLLSIEYFERNQDSRKKALELILKKYHDQGLGDLVWQSIRAALLIDSIKEITLEKDYIRLEDFNNWLKNFDLPLSLVKENEFNLPKDLDEKLVEIFTYIKSSVSYKETEIKANFTFFGIMKSLRINIDDIDFE